MFGTLDDVQIQAFGVLNSEWNLGTIFVSGV